MEHIEDIAEKTKQGKDVIIFHVISEPGDMTRYDFVVMKWTHEYVFMPLGSTFRFPQKLNVFRKYTESLIYDIADRNRCNPCTVKECIRVMNIIEKRKEQEKRKLKKHG